MSLYVILLIIKPTDKLMLLRHPSCTASTSASVPPKTMALRGAEHTFEQNNLLSWFKDEAS